MSMQETEEWDDKIATTEDEIGATSDEDSAETPPKTKVIVSLKKKQSIEGKHVWKMMKALIPYMIMLLIIFCLSQGIIYLIKEQTNQYCTEIIRIYGEYFGK